MLLCAGCALCCSPIPNRLFGVLPAAAVLARTTGRPRTTLSRPLRLPLPFKPTTLAGQQPGEAFPAPAFLSLLARNGAWRLFRVAVGFACALPSVPPRKRCARDVVWVLDGAFCGDWWAQLAHRLRGLTTGDRIPVGDARRVFGYKSMGQAGDGAAKRGLSDQQGAAPPLDTARGRASRRTHHRSIMDQRAPSPGRFRATPPSPTAYPDENGAGVAGFALPSYGGRAPEPSFNAFSTLGPVSLNAPGPAAAHPALVPPGGIIPPRVVAEPPAVSSFSLPLPSMLDRLVPPLYPTTPGTSTPSKGAAASSARAASAVIGPAPRARTGSGQRRRLATPVATPSILPAAASSLHPPTSRSTARASGTASNNGVAPTAAASGQGGVIGRIEDAAMLPADLSVVGAGNASPSSKPGMSQFLDKLYVKVDHVAKTVAGLAEKLDMLVDAVSGNTKQVDAHGKSLEGMGKAVTGMRASIDKFDKAVMGSYTGGTSPIASPAEDDVGKLSDEDAEVSFGGEEEGHSLVKARRVGSAAVDVKNTPTRAAAVALAQHQADARVKGMHDAIAVRCVLSDVVPSRIGAARTCAEVYSDVATFSDLVKAHTMDTLGLTHAAAVTWLMTHVNQPTKGKETDARSSKKRSASNEPTTVRPIKLLKAVQPHLIGSLKKRILPVYFAALGLDMYALPLITVMTWLINNEYTKSPVGKKAICECLVSLFGILGAAERVETLSVGSGRVIRASIGHYALVSAFVRYFLEGLKDKLYRERALAQLRPRRTGAEPGVYLYFRAEVFRVDTFLDQDDQAHDGLVLTDGGAVDRAKLCTAEDDQAATMYNRQQIVEINYPSKLATLVAEKEARDKAARATQGVRE